MGALTKTERDLLVSLEGEIELGISASIRVGEAFLEIRERKLFRGGYTSFNEYIRDRWNCGQNYASKMIAAYEARKRVDDLVPKLPEADAINTEGQLREITNVPESMLEQVVSRGLEIAEEEGKKVSGSILRRAKKETLGPPASVSSGAKINDAAAKNARIRIPLIVRSLRLQLGAIGLADRFDAVLDEIEEASA